MSDIRVQDEGSLVIAHGDTDEGRDWLEENLDPDGLRWAGGHVIELRYVGPILEGAADAGLTIS